MKKVIFLICAFLVSIGLFGQVSHGTNYKIQAKNNGKYFDISGSSSGSSLTQSTSGNTWKFIQKSGGWYQIKVAASGLYIANFQNRNESAPIKVTNAPGDGALWKLESVGGGYYRLRNKLSQKCIANGGAQSSGAQLKQFAAVQTGGHWKFVSGQNQGNTVFSQGLEIENNGLTLEIETEIQTNAPTGIGTSTQMKKNFLHNIGLPEEEIYFSFVEEAVKRQLRTELGRTPTALQIRNKLNSMSETDIKDRTFVILHLKNIVVEIAKRRSNTWTSSERKLIEHLSEILRQQNMMIANATLAKWNDFKKNENFKPDTQLGLLFGSNAAPDPKKFTPPTGYEGLNNFQKLLVAEYITEASGAGVEVAIGGSMAIVIPGISLGIASGIIMSKYAATQVMFLAGQYASGTSFVMAAKIASAKAAGITIPSSTAAGTGGAAIGFGVGVPITVSIVSAILIGYEAFRIQKAKDFENSLQKQAYWAQGRVDIPSIASNLESLEVLWTKMDYFFGASMKSFKSSTGGAGSNGSGLTWVNNNQDNSTNEKLVKLKNKSANILKFQVSYLENGRRKFSAWSSNLSYGVERYIKVPMNKKDYRILVQTTNKNRVVADQAIPDDHAMVFLEIKGTLKEPKVEDEHGLGAGINVELKNKSTLLIKYRLKYNQNGSTKYSSFSPVFGQGGKKVVEIDANAQDVLIEIKTNNNNQLVSQSINRNQGQKYTFRGNANRPVFEGEGMIIGEGIKVELKNKTSNIVKFYLYYTDENGTQQATQSSQNMSNGMARVVSAPDIVNNLNIKVHTNNGRLVLDRPISNTKQSQKFELTGSLANPKLSEDNGYVQVPGINIEMKNTLGRVVNFYCYYYQNGVQKNSQKKSGNMSIGTKRTINVPGDIEKLYIKVHTQAGNLILDKEINKSSKAYKLTGNKNNPRLENL